MLLRWGCFVAIHAPQRFGHFANRETMLKTIERRIVCAPPTTTHVWEGEGGSASQEARRLYAPQLLSVHNNNNNVVVVVVRSHGLNHVPLSRDGFSHTVGVRSLNLLIHGAAC